MTRWTLLLLVLAIAGCQSPTPQGGKMPVQTVANMDLARYVGKWYEIANFPMIFQSRCIGDTTADYRPQPDGSIAITNRCRTESGFDEASGTAVAVEGSNNARLKVRFVWPMRADYWVIGLDPDFRWAVVGEPGREYLWILSRTPQLPKDQMDAALASAVAQGYDLAPLKYTPHGGK